MSWSTTAKGAGVLGVGAGSFATVALSPVPMLVLGAVALLVLGPIAVVVLTATLSCHPVRRANAAAVLDRLIIAVTANRWQPPDLVTTTVALPTETKRTTNAYNRTQQRRPRHQAQ